MVLVTISDIIWSLLTNLGRKVVLEHAQTVNLVLHHNWLLTVQAQTSVRCQRSRLVKHTQISNRELLAHALRNF